MMKKIMIEPKKPLSWLEKMVGKDIALKGYDLFQPPIRVADKHHAKALHAKQDKGYRYQNKLS